MMENAAAEEAVPEVQHDPGLMVRGSNRLGIRLLRGVADELERNVVVCPPAAAAAVSVIINGAHGETRDELAGLLAPGEGPEEINGSCEALNEELGADDSAVRVAGASGLWALRGLPLKDAFVRAVKGPCRTEIRRFSPGDPEALDNINEWMSERTGGGFVSPVDWIAPDMVLFMLNAASLKGRWNEPFDVEATVEGDFHAPGGTRTADFMVRSGPVGHMAGRGFSAVRLPFEDGRTAMYVLAPDRDSTVGSILEGLGPESLASWAAGFRDQDVVLRLPRFRCSFGLELTEAMRPLGVRSAFSRIYSDLSELSPTTDDIFIGMLRHLARLEVTETGAGTGPASPDKAGDEAVGETPSSRPDPVGAEGLELTVDRPFVVAVTDEPTGAALFMGCVVDP